MFCFSTRYISSIAIGALEKGFFYKPPPIYWCGWFLPLWTQLGLGLGKSDSVQIYLSKGTYAKQHWLISRWLITTYSVTIIIITVVTLFMRCTITPFTETGLLSSFLVIFKWFWTLTNSVIFRSACNTFARCTFSP